MLAVVASAQVSEGWYTTLLVSWLVKSSNWGERLTPVTRDTSPALAFMADNVAVLACMVHLP